MSNVVIDFAKKGKPRQLTYKWTALRSISQRLNGMTLMEFLSRLASQQPDCLSVALMVGLSSDDKRLTMEKVDTLIQEHIDAKGKLSELVNLVLEALETDGLLHKEKGSDEDPTGANSLHG